MQRWGSIWLLPSENSQQKIEILPWINCEEDGSLSSSKRSKTNSWNWGWWKPFSKCPPKQLFNMIEADVAPTIRKKTCTSTYWNTWTLSTHKRVFVRVKQACHPQIFAISPLFDHFPSISHDFSTTTPHALMEKDVIWKNMVKSGLSLLDLSLLQPFSPQLGRALKSFLVRN